MFTYKEKSSNPTGLAWYSNIAAVLLLWNTNMVAVTLFSHYSHARFILFCLKIPLKLETGISWYCSMTKYNLCTSSSIRHFTGVWTSSEKDPNLYFRNTKLVIRRVQSLESVGVLTLNRCLNTTEYGQEQRQERW